MTDRARAIRTRLLIGVAAILTLNVILAAANELLPSGRIDGDSGSSYVTTPDGTAAWFELLRRRGSEPRRLTASLAEGGLDPGEALVIVDVPTVDAPSLAAVDRFARSGGLVVVASPDGEPGDLAEALLVEHDVELAFDTSTEHGVVGTHPATRSVSAVESDGRQAWTASSSVQSLLAGADGTAFAITFSVGEGAVVLLADGTPLMNRLLDHADNAAFAVAVLQGRRAVFDEFSHGYTADFVSEPLLPRSWRWTLYLLGVAIVVFLVAVGRRLGPPEPVTRRLPPPRRWYVESLASTLSRTDPAEATEPIRIATYRRMLERAGLDEGASPQEVRAAGAALGIDAGDLSSLVRPAEDDLDVLAIGRAMAAVSAPPGSPTSEQPPSPAIVPGPGRGAEGQ